MCPAFVSSEPSLSPSSSAVGKDFHSSTCAQPVWGLLESGSARAHSRPSTPTSLAAEEGPRRDQTVRQPHSRRMKHAWKVTCLAHQPTCRRSSFTDPQADLGFESPLLLCDRANDKSLSLGPSPMTGEQPDLPRMLL